MIKKRYFITGTDTGVGKTTVSLMLLSQFGEKGFSTAAIKPVAAGAIKTDFGFRNDYAIKLQAAMTTTWPYENINPFLLNEPISPNLSAKHQKINLTADKIVSACQPILNSNNIDIVIVEGAGGCHTPLNDQETFADVAKALDIPIILVVGLRLGCLNHALLTVQAIQSSGLKIAGWVANQVDYPMLYVEENIHYLKKRLHAPLLGIQPKIICVDREFNKADFIALQLPL